MIAIARVALAFAAFLTASLPVVDQGNRLGGLRAVKVFVHPSPSEKLQDLPLDEYRVAVEARLRSAGIPVVDDTESVPGRPVLFVSIDLRDELGFAHAELELREDATLVRVPRRIVRAVTWQGMGMAKQSAREALQKPIDEFVNDYLKANGHS